MPVVDWLGSLVGLPVAVRGRTPFPSKVCEPFLPDLLEDYRNGCSSSEGLEILGVYAVRFTLRGLQHPWGDPRYVHGEPARTAAYCCRGKRTPRESKTFHSFRLPTVACHYVVYFQNFRNACCSLERAIHEANVPLSGPAGNVFQGDIPERCRARTFASGAAPAWLGLLPAVVVVRRVERQTSAAWRKPHQSS